MACLETLFKIFIDWMKSQKEFNFRNDMIRSNAHRIWCGDISTCRLKHDIYFVLYSHTETIVLLWPYARKQFDIKKNSWATKFWYCMFQIVKSEMAHYYYLCLPNWFLNLEIFRIWFFFRRIVKLFSQFNNECVICCDNISIILLKMNWLFVIIFISSY